MKERNQRNPQTSSQNSPEVDGESRQRMEVGGFEAPVNVSASGISNEHGADEPLDGSRNVSNSSNSYDGPDHAIENASMNEVGRDADENASEQASQDPQDTQIAATFPSMSRQETIWWAMSFEELYQHARSKKFGKSGKEGRKSGRVRIIQWLCEKENITPYVAPSTAIVDPTPIITQPMVRPTGAISHPEAILRTSDPALQRSIKEAEREYKHWPAADLLVLAMERSYQLRKDSHGKLPSKSVSAMANWLAAWDVLKSPREKKWWTGDGIDLVNRAKAMGYQGSSKKYDVILWLRSTPEKSEVEVTLVAEPTPNRKPLKRKAELAPQPVSKRPAKGSKRPNGWHLPQEIP
ncbi:hypothetical protein LSUE1_G006739 [Lachnellula suecica]|uniref:Uncharacterized protein n=1 Tax=Lachnellula suecica TaxID=602035 RepID=A0A8T9C7C0_9HELO|nr:hypothetical protein LSUE1_G006739 [Lachnellula suecica]